MRFSFASAVVVSAVLVAQGSATVALTHVNVIDVVSGEVRPDMTVVVADGRISSVEAAASARVSPSAQVHDAAGAFVIPGLWDMHVHWLDDDYVPLFIANGVTGIRIMWGAPQHQQWRRAIERGKMIGPRLVIGSAIIDGPNPVWPRSVVAANAKEGRAAVDAAIREGAEFIKVYSRLPRDAYFAIAEESKRRGVPFAGHVPNAVSTEEASDAGQASIEHLTGIRRDLGRFDAQKAAALFERFRRNHTWQVPTLTVLRSNAYRSDSAYLGDPRLRYLPADMVRRWQNAAAETSRSPAEIENGHQIYRREVDIVGAMYRAGVDLLAGTDVSNPFCLPGFSLHDELALLVDAGLTPLDALRTATLNPARFLKRESESGSVDAGKAADLVVLDANPLTDIRNTTKIRAVVAAGRYYDRIALDRMLRPNSGR